MTIERMTIKYSYTALLLIALILISVYSIACTPFVFNKRMGILLMSVISQTLWTVCSLIFTNTFELEIDDKELEKIQNKENVIVIGNHIGAIDFMVINEISKRKNMLRHSKFMLKNSIKYVPILGYVQFLGFLMLKRNYEKDAQTIRDWLSYFCTNNVPFWLIIYPEGTRITPKKKVVSDKFCDEKGLTRLQNVLYPRTKGFELSCQQLKGSIKHIVDLTVLYEGINNYDVPSLFNFVFGMPEGKIKIKVNVYKLDDITDYSEFVKERFYEKDILIQKWKDVKNK